jgi:hypothetical protein
MLTPFATRGVSMTKFESRPSRVALWEYLFFVDIEGHRDDSERRRRAGGGREIAGYLKVLGSYPAAVLDKAARGKRCAGGEDTRPAKHRAGNVRGIAPMFRQAHRARPRASWTSESDYPQDGSNERSGGTPPEALAAIRAR